MAHRAFDTSGTDTDFGDRLVAVARSPPPTTRFMC